MSILRTILNTWDQHRNRVSVSLHYLNYYYWWQWLTTTDNLNSGGEQSTQQHRRTGTTTTAIRDDDNEWIAEPVKRRRRDDDRSCRRWLNWHTSSRSFPPPPPPPPKKESLTQSLSLLVERPRPCQVAFRKEQRFLLLCPCSLQAILLFLYVSTYMLADLLMETCMRLVFILNYSRQGLTMCECRFHLPSCMKWTIRNDRCSIETQR